MKVLDKIKDLFADDEEEEVVDTVKKEVIQVEITAPKNPVIEEKEVKKEEDASPFFDDRDFEEIKRSNPTLEEMYAREEKKEVYKGKRDEGKKHFEPTPIISPVYGVLDKNYKKDDIVNKAEPPRENRDITLDEVRNKAYGTLEDELENTLFGRTSIMFQERDKASDKEKATELQEIEDDLKETAEAIEMLNDDEAVITIESPKHEKKEEDLEDTIITTALEAGDNDIKEEKKEEVEDIKDVIEDVKEEIENHEGLSENDLFDLIDDMYGKGE